MARIFDIKKIPLDDLEIGKGQSRTRDIGKGLEELEDSIRKVGQLEPIVICPGSKPDKYEILTGQRRFLACKVVGLPTIWATVLDERVDETAAKVISLTENLMRRELNRRDKIDACTYLYKRYGTIKDVVEETGLPYNEVSTYVKYDRLLPDLKELVDKGDIDVQTAVRAQDAAAVEGGPKTNVTKAVHLAWEMKGMSDAQQKRVTEQIREDPVKGVLDVIETAKAGPKLVQFIVTVGANVNSSLLNYAKDEGTTRDNAAASLIGEGLETRGYLEEQE